MRRPSSFMVSNQSSHAHLWPQISTRQVTTQLQPEFSENLLDWQQFDVKPSKTYSCVQISYSTCFFPTCCDSRFCRCRANWLKITCPGVRFSILPNKGAGPYRRCRRPPVSLSCLCILISLIVVGYLKNVRFAQSRSWETSEFQVVFAMAGCWQGCQLQSQSQSKDTAAPVAYCDYFARYCEWNMSLLDLRSSLFMRGKKNVFVQQVTKNKILSLKLDPSVIYAVEILLKQCGWTTTEDLKHEKNMYVLIKNIDYWN